MAEDKQTNNTNPIDLSAVQNNEQKAAIDESILASEEALLSKPTATPATGPSTGAPGGAQPVVTAQDEAKFHIPAVVRDKYPELISLIIRTESMDDEEREYWFQMIPIMTNEQILKLRDILISEKEQLAKLDSEYEQELKKIDEKHLQEWQEFEIKQKKEEIAKNEAAKEKEEKATEEELLKKLQNL